MRTLGAIILTLALVGLACPALAEVATIETSHRFVAGDAYSRLEASRLCFLEAKRKASEEAGGLIEVVSKSQNFELTQDEVRSYSAALIKSELVAESFEQLGETFAVACTVISEVDTDSVEALVRELKAASQASGQDLGQTGQQTGQQAAPQTATPEASGAAPAQSAPAPSAPTPSVQAPPALSTQAALARTAPSMGMAQAEAALGPPLAMKQAEVAGSLYQCAAYAATPAPVFLVFKDGLALCAKKRLQYMRQYGGDCHCAGFASNFFWR